jgi:dTDP-4-dehydrorhamnose reductase
MKIYILGITGLLGSEFFVRFIESNKYLVKGSTRLKSVNNYKIFHKYKNKIDFGVNTQNLITIEQNLKKFKPDYVINCIGWVKQKISEHAKSSEVFYINSVFPKKLYIVTQRLNAKLIHFSTDCVFDGKAGNYSEKNVPNARDLYGFSKYLGELSGNNVVTIRTSVIGHEINGKFGLLEWFLKKKKQCLGFAYSYFSGLTSFEIYNFVDNYLFKNIKINGLIHLSSTKISKLRLLKIIAKIYGKKILIKKSFKIKINRTLDNTFVKKKLSYKSPSWNQMIKIMYLNRVKDLKNN